MGKKVTAQAIGGNAVTFEQIATVGDVKREMGLETYTANVNGNPANDSTQLADYAFVTLATPAKAGC